MVMEVVQEDVEEDSMQCGIHPNKNNTPGAICAFCLQEKLGNLVSSAFSVAIFLSSPSPPPSPSVNSTINGTSTTMTTTSTTTITSSAITLRRSASTHSNQIFTRRATLPFLLVQRMNKKKTKDVDIAFKRCNSLATPRQGMHLPDQRESNRTKKRGFWPFLYSTSSSSSSKHTIAKKLDKACRDLGFMAPSSSSSTNMRNGTSGSSKEKKKEMVVEEHDLSPEKASTGRRVSRSRSVGCGSKSFSGDFFGRISTGLGDCTLRRVESHREGKTKNGMHRNGGQNNGQDCIKERVKCGGIFGSFMINNSSSSSSSSTEDHRRTPANMGHHHNNPGRAFASPMRFFSSKHTNNRGGGGAQTKNVAPNLTSTPSLVTGSKISC